MKAFVITLQQSELARRIANESINAANNFGINAEIYPAVLGYDSNPLFKKYNITQYLNHTIAVKSGHQGCFLSHFELWLKCIELDQPIIILEHDGIFIRPLPNDILENFYEICRLDAFDRWLPGYNQKIQNSLNKSIDYNGNPTAVYYHSSGNYYVGAYGYIVKPQGAVKLVRFARERGIVCTEAHIGSNIVDIVNVSATIVRLHEHYIDRGYEDSATNDLYLFVKEQENIFNLKYISPSNYKKLYGDFV